MYKCRVCHDNLAKSQFEPYKIGKICRQCRNKRRAELRMSSVDRYIRSTVSRKKAHCKKNNIEFNLTYEHLLDRWEGQNGLCFYTFEKLEILRFRTKEQKLYSPSLDRVDPTKGYIDGNVVWCINKANIVKSSLTLEELHKWIPEWYGRIKYEF